MPRRPKPVKRPWIASTDYNKQPGQGRKVVTGFYHTKAWRTLRNAFLKGYSTHLGTAKPHSNALCIECARKGITRETHTIDHIKPLNREDPYDTRNGLYGEPLQWENLQPLCEHCNAVKTARERHNK